MTKLDDESAALLTEIPEERGATVEMPPSDPLIYRFYEIVQGYGPTLKALINEEFGDGIMSAIDFTMEIEREPDPNGDRVKITMSGSFSRGDTLPNHSQLRMILLQPGLLGADWRPGRSVTRKWPENGPWTRRNCKGFLARHEDRRKCFAPASTPGHVVGTKLIRS